MVNHSLNGLSLTRIKFTPAAYSCQSLGSLVFTMRTACTHSVRTKTPTTQAYTAKDTGAQMHERIASSWVEQIDLLLYSISTFRRKNNLIQTMKLSVSSTLRVLCGSSRCLLSFCSCSERWRKSTAEHQLRGMVQKKRGRQHAQRGMSFEQRLTSRRKSREVAARSVGAVNRQPSGQTRSFFLVIVCFFRNNYTCNCWMYLAFG